MQNLISVAVKHPLVLHSLHPCKHVPPPRIIWSVMLKEHLHLFRVKLPSKLLPGFLTLAVTSKCATASLRVCFFGCCFFPWNQEQLCSYTAKDFLLSPSSLSSSVTLENLRVCSAKARVQEKGLPCSTWVFRATLESKFVDAYKKCDEYSFVPSNFPFYVHFSFSCF